MVVLGSIGSGGVVFTPIFECFLSCGSLVAFFGYSDRWGSELFA